MIDLTPIRQKLLSKMKHPADFRSVAVSHVVLCPAETVVAPPAIYLEGDLDNVIAVQADTNLQLEMTRLRGGPRNHEATIAYTLHDVEFLPSGLYKGAMRHVVRQTRDPLIGLPAKEIVL